MVAIGKPYNGLPFLSISDFRKIEELPPNTFITILNALNELEAEII